MIIVCQTCSSRLQVDEKTLNRAVNVRCPKCNSTIPTGPNNPTMEQSALAVGGSPATDHPRFEPATARAYEPAKTGAGTNESIPTDDAVRMLAELLSKGTRQNNDNPNARPSWDKRKALVCASETYRDVIALKLTQGGFQVYVAEDTRQAVETMRANKLDLVLLEPQFDAGEQGAAFVIREINVLRPPQRRRLFFVLVSPSLRTMDAHAAFLNNVNAIVNVNDLEGLPQVMEVALREYNELYREFYRAFGLTAL